MLDEFVDAFADLMDVVDRGVSSIMKGPHPRPKPQGMRPYSYRQQSSTNTTRPRTVAQWKWSAPLVGSSTPSTSSTRSKHYLPKHIPFQKKPRAQPPPKLRASKSLAPTRGVALTPMREVPERPNLKAIRSPSSNLLKAPTSHKRTGLLSSDVQIDVSRCDILVVAIADLETCKELFGGWSAQFNIAGVKRKDKIEQGIVSAVAKLNSDTTSALHSSYAILSSYRALTRLMDKQLDAISRSPSGGGDLFSGSAGSELRRLSSSVKAHSIILSERVRKVQDCLSALVHDIEKTKERAASKALRRKIWHWFVRIFRALSVLISAGGTIFTLVNPVGFIGSLSIAAASTLAAAVAKLCEVVEKRFSESTFDSILRLLREQIPESAKAAELSLTSFQACHRILQLELQVRAGERNAWMGASEARRAHRSWKEAGQRLSAVER